MKSIKKIVVLTALASVNSVALAAFKFGDPWALNGVSTCSVLNSKKAIQKYEYPLHTGVDYLQKSKTQVIVTGDLYHYKTHLDSSGWRYFVIACTILKKGVCDDTNSKNVFYNFLHLEAAKLTPGQSLKNVQIGTVADLSSKGAADHVHYAKWSGAWQEGTSYSGKLYSTDCNNPKESSWTKPTYPQNFSDPGSPLFKFK